MSSLIEVLKNSFIVLKKQPKLFFPKIFLALVWGLMLLFAMNLLKKMQVINLLSSLEEKTFLLNKIFPEAVFLLVLSFIFFVFDSVINSAYPLMIQNYLNKKSISVSVSIKEVLKNFTKIVVPVLFAFILSMIILVPFITFFSFSFVQNNLFFSVLSGLVILIAVFIVTVLFYFIYPVAAIEKKGLSSVFNAVKKSFKNIKEASFGTFIALILSLISAFIVSFAETELISILALIVFAVLRIITAVLATYSMVLNPLLYFKE